ncbi:T9SS type A sorting domain-containing protein [Flavobacterium sufflavum]|uniref:T9SS type A sorting domain-containing protein n=1 Tax=Flavobacterium sufflavum TaxID=1921138 RepID=A0A3S2W9A1_9FLAO|nr:T9SS type A sorting domain-containing protein [Flavobacterium sufflavum]RVT71968.1 T9SS type A sorting domain-containing protein [Flavobacterium sufflavum]
MKKTTQKGVCLLLLLGSMLGYSQESPEAKKALLTARLQLIEGSSYYNPTAALATYQQQAAAGNAEAMNGLGLLYSKGIGVAVDEQQGINWLEKAAENGYAKAWYNLGLLYKEGVGATQNQEKAIVCFEKAAKGGYDTAWNTWGGMVMKGKGTAQNYPLAISIFQQGADKGNAACLYSLGYLHYKGFGFPQDYAKAIELFELAAEKRNPVAMYMLGLCYRNGYGVAIDTEKAKYWLNKSAALGFKDSEKELADPEPENANPNQEKTVSITIPEVISITETVAPETFKKVKQAPITANISGNYTGYLLRYDWSGQNIISKTPLQIDLQQDGKQLAGEWREIEGDTAVFTAKIQDDAIVFHDSKIKRTEHFYKGSLNTYEFKEAKLQLLQTEESLYLVGNLQLFNIRERENEKPMYLILEKKQAQTTVTVASEILSKVVVYPNPFSSSFELSFDLTESTNVTASVHSLSGQMLFTTQWNNLNPGAQNKTISLNAPSGYYLLHLTYGTEVKTSILIKK